MDDLQCTFRPKAVRTVRAHTHARIEWHYVIDGSCDLVVGQRTRRIGRGELCAVPARKEHHIRMRTADDWLLQYVALYDPAPDLWRAWNRRCAGGGLHIGLVHQAAFARLARDSTATTPWARRAAAHRFEALLCELLADTPSGGASHPAVDRALALMHRKLRERLDLDGLAAHVAVSRHHFSRLFAAQVGAPPLRHFTSLKMDLAASLLRDGDEPVATVAAALGYADPFHFSRVFRRVHGVSPGIWRERER